jgi:hypothetical protein
MMRIMVSNAGSGPPPGVTHPDDTPGCAKAIAGSPPTKLTRYWNTFCLSAPAEYQFGNEPRVDDTLRAQCIDTFDPSVAKKVQITERRSIAARSV